MRPVLVVEACGQAECPNIATHRMYWPGSRPLVVCQAHRLMAMGIADCMGFELVIEPIQLARGRAS